MIPGIGVFGTGALANVLVPILREKGFTIVAIWGRTLREAEEASKELNIPFFTNKIDDVLLRKDVDLVFIICPPFLHAQISVKALGIGKHVVCDKPMGLGQLNALKMVRASQYYPTLIALVNHSLRFLPAFVQMKKYITEEYFGPANDISLIDVRVQLGSLLHSNYDWLCDANMGGGILNLVGSHIIDIVTYLTERRAIRAYGVLRTFTKTTSTINGIRQISAADFCNFQLELENGVLVTASLHSHLPNSIFQQEILICGRDGYLTVRGGDLFGQRQKINSTRNSHEMKEEALYVDVQELQCTNPVSMLPKPYIKGLCKMISALKDSFAANSSGWIKEPVQSAATFEDGHYVQAVMDAIKKSSETKSWSAVTILSESPTNQTKLLNAARISAVVLN